MRTARMTLLVLLLFIVLHRLRRARVVMKLSAANSVVEPRNPLSADIRRPMDRRTGAAEWDHVQ